MVIYDLMGREIYSHMAFEEAGQKEVVWNGQGRDGRMMPSGIYLYRIVACANDGNEHFTASKKMVLLK